MVLLEEVVASANEFGRIDEEIRVIQDEWKGIRANVRERLEPLKTRKEELEKVILDYLQSNDLPGVRLNGSMFMREEIPCYKTKEAKIEDILKNEPPATQPDVITKKIVAALRKRQAAPTNANTSFRLKVIRP